jgi:hypothetical protein
VTSLVALRTQITTLTDAARSDAFSHLTLGFACVKAR